MTSVNGTSAATTVQQATGGMSIEAFMQMVYAQKAENLEAQQVDQVNDIKSRQNDIAKLNQLMADLRALRPSGDDGNKWADLGDSKQAGRDMVARLKDAGVSISTTGADGAVGSTNEGGGNGIYDAKQISFDKWIEEIKGKLDSLNSDSQMSMIRLQSINNKHNQTIEALSNLVSKTAKMNDTIIGNMR